MTRLGLGLSTKRVVSGMSEYAVLLASLAVGDPQTGKSVSYPPADSVVNFTQPAQERTLRVQTFELDGRPVPGDQRPEMFDSEIAVTQRESFRQVCIEAANA